MDKITELKKTKWRTRHYRDAFGNRHRKKEEYIANRIVKCISPGPRFGHFVIDIIIFQILLITIWFVLGLLFMLYSSNQTITRTIEYFESIIGLVFYPLYYIIFEYIWQRTPGKFLTKSLVIDEYGNKPTLRAIVLRSLIRVVPFETFSCLEDKYKRSYGWHDKWSNTWVVTENELKELKRLQLEQNSFKN